MDQLAGRVAVVTGAASGIGRGMARAFAREGMRVVLADIEPSALEMVRAELEATGAEALAVPSDVSKAESVEALAERAYQRFGAVHVLCNNAGVFSSGVTWEQTLEDWRWVLGVNLWGVVHGIRSFVPRMIASGEPGHVVSTASGAGLVSLSGTACYNVSKHAVVTLSETMAQELAARGAAIRVSVLCPGPINTGITRSDRNRPSELGTSRETRTDEKLREMLEHGMDPDQVGRIVVEGIRCDRFYILTHEDLRTGVERRMRVILDDGDPAAGRRQRQSGAAAAAPARTGGRGE